LRFWIDIENPPQVQYLLPLVGVLEERGMDVLITARDEGITFEILRNRQVPFHPVGRQFGKGRIAKARGVFARSRALLALVRRGDRPIGLISSSRASALAARSLGIPSFIVCDYEYADLRLYRLAGSYVLHPDVIDSEAFLGRGFRRERVISFAGLKEDISFTGTDIDAVTPHTFEIDDQLVRVLFRPPAEESHYHSARSRQIALELLGYLADRKAAVVIFSPRYAWQSQYLSRFKWANPPVLLREAVPFISLLRGVDLVVSSGGTMVREAAWLGVPVYSIFQSEIGTVDRYLNSIGRLEFISSPQEFARLHLARLTEPAPRMQVSGVPQQLVEAVLDRSGAPVRLPGLPITMQRDADQ
jgi:predicted glycosyltransferase